MPLVFEQQPKESAKAFAAFSLYLGLGPERSLAAVGKKLGKSGTVIERWSAKFDWPARVKAHAAYFAVVEREATEALTRAKGVDWVQRQEEHRAEEWKVRCELIELARAAIARWKANEKRCGSLEGIARLLDLASRLGRLASGMPTDKTEITGENGGPIMVEFEAAVRKIYGAAAPPGAVVDVEAVPLAPALAGSAERPRRVALPARGETDFGGHRMTGPQRRPAKCEERALSCRRSETR